MEFFRNDHFDHDNSRHRLLLPDCRSVAAERKERRLSRGFRRSGQPDRLWAARRGIGSFSSDDLVGDHFHAHLDHAFDLCGAPNRAHIRPFRNQTVADEIATGDASHSVRTAADTKIILLLRAGRSRHQKGIPFPLLADSRSRAVPRNHNRLIRQSHHPVVQRAHDLFERSSRQVGASNAAGKQRVTSDQ